MAKKNKKKQKQKKSRIIGVLAKEYKYENLLIILLATIVAILSIYLIDGSLIFNGAMFGFLVGNEWTFGVVMLIFSLVSAGAFIYPFFKPSFHETKKVTFPAKSHVWKQTMRVLIFILVLSLIFLAFGLLYKYILIELLEVV